MRPRPEIGGVRQDRGEQRVLVVAALAGAQIGEGGREAGRPVHLVQQFGDAHARHHRVDRVGEGARLRRGDCLDRRDMQSAVTQLDPLQLAAPQPASEALQPTVEFGGLPRQPFVRRCRQAKRLPRRPERRRAAADSCRSGDSWTNARPRRRPSAACRAASPARRSRRGAGSVIRPP